MKILKPFSRANDFMLHVDNFTCDVEVIMILLNSQQVLMSNIQVVCLFHQNLHQNPTKVELLKVLQVYRFLICYF